MIVPGAQVNYPENLCKSFIFNSPRIFTYGWKVCSPCHSKGAPCVMCSWEEILQIESYPKRHATCSTPLVRNV
jgi:hypothetical protein